MRIIHAKVSALGDSVEPALVQPSDWNQEHVIVLDEGESFGAGPQGPAGADGVAGPQGPAGADGVAGPQGLAGADGVAGPQGLAGADGVAGPQGPAGADGVAGPQGPAGADGVAGPQGPAGADGVAGPQGPAGADGVAGPQGPAGADGVAGPAGSGGGVTVLPWVPVMPAGCELLGSGIEVIGRQRRCYFKARILSGAGDFTLQSPMPDGLWPASVTRKYTIFSAANAYLAGGNALHTASVLALVVFSAYNYPGNVIDVVWEFG